ncbi:MAG: penicillin-binding protein activator [Myxococcales bacterium]|nr:penicillin-binding protein activator [Myxococcales bacterium]
MQPKSMRLLATALFALALCGCPKRDGATRPDGDAADQPRYVAKKDPQADIALEQAVQVEDTQPKEKAVEAYLAVRKAYPETTAAQESLFRAGVIYYQSGQFANARKSLQELLFENPLFEKAQAAKLLVGLSALEVGAHRDAYQTLFSLAERAVGPERRRALEGAARAAEGAQLFEEALRIAIHLVDEAPPDDRPAALERITELVEGRIGFLDVAKVKQDLPLTHPAWPILTFKLCRIYYHLRDWQRLDESLKAFLREAPTHPFAEQAKELLTRSGRRSETKPNVLGVILPMSGKYKQLGEAVMRGVGLALGGSGLEVVVKDSQGDVNLAGKQVEELVFDEGAIAIIGPLLGDEARRAALVAEELQIPVLTLAKSEDITAIGPHVFRNMLTNSQQAQALADYAMETLGYKRFALLYPDIPFGDELANQFWDEVLKRGGEVRGAEKYAHDQTTYTTQVQSLVGRGEHRLERADYRERLQEIQQARYDAYRKRKAIEKLNSQLEPVVDFEALLIPDSWQRVGLVTPALAVEDIITNACDPKDLERIKKTTGRRNLKTVTLLGTSTWSSPKGRSGLPELIERGGKFVTCSVYVDGFFADSDRPATKKFVHAFQEAYKDTQPTLLDATGYDSAMMIRRLVEKSSPRTREELMLGLATLRDFDGATGRTHFNDRREAMKPLFFLSIESNGVHELEPKPKASGT